jgi:hypothetical protein
MAHPDPKVALAQRVYRSSLATNAKRLRGDGARAKSQNARDDDSIPISIAL